MQRVHLFSIVVCRGLAASAAAGDLWITCEPGLEIFLDGEPVGVSEEAEFGKILREITAGDHAVRIQKEGFAAKEFVLTVGYAANQVVVGALSQKAPEKPVESTDTQSDEKPVGMVIITSDPRECNVKIGEKRIPKIKPIMTFPLIPVGEHTFWFENSGVVLKEKVRVQSNQPVEVMVEWPKQRIGGAADTPEVPGVESAVEEEPRAEAECVEYWIEVLRTSNFEEIEPYQQLLKDLGFPREHQKVVTIEDDGAAPIYKLRVGPIERSKKAKWAAGLIRNAGIPTVWVVPAECQSVSERAKREFKPRISGG